MLNACFTRIELLELTEVSSNRLQYLERVGLIIPCRVEKTGRKTVLYSWEQILLIKYICLPEIEKYPNAVIKKIINFICMEGVKRTMQLVSVNEHIQWVDFDLREIPAIITNLEKKNATGFYTVSIFPNFENIVIKVWEKAKRSKIVDIAKFRERARNF